MTFFSLHTASSAPHESKALLEAVQGKFGFVPNLMKTFAESSVALQAYLSLSEIFDKSSFNPVEKQVILLSVSSENQCDYCVAAHSFIAKNMAKADGPTITAAVSNSTVSDTRLNALIQFTHHLVKNRGFAEESQIANFLNAGYTKRHILEVITAVAMKTLSNYTSHIGHTPVDEQFGPK